MKVAAFGKLLALSVVVAAPLGCAPEYRCYRGCCVDCQYCEPAPLPYQLYDECACHSCVAETYLANRPVASPAASDVDVPTVEEAP